MHLDNTNTHMHLYNDKHSYAFRQYKHLDNTLFALLNTNRMHLDNTNTHMHLDNTNTHACLQCMHCLNTNTRFYCAFRQYKVHNQCMHFTMTIFRNTNSRMHFYNTNTVCI